MENNTPAIFEKYEIRRVFDAETETWWFSVVDVVQILTGSPNARDYWFRMKVRVRQEDGSELSTLCRQFKMKAPDGKMRATDAADVQGLLRIIQSIPSPKAEPIKLWLAKVGYERMQEMADPGLAVERAKRTWEKAGRSENWVKNRLMGLETRIRLTDYWATHDIKGGEFAMLTNIIHQEWSGVTVKQHKEIKGLQNQNLRDHMSEAELIFTALAELSTRQIAEHTDATGFMENAEAAQQGGAISRSARMTLEEKTGRPVVSAENYLPAMQQGALPPG